MLTRALQDGFKPVDSWVGQGIQWLDDLQQFYRERSAIEKEYSAKLAGLAKKYYEKKTRKSSALSVGETPSMTPGSLESASLTTWTTQLSALEARAADHDRFGSELISQVATPLQFAMSKYDELRKSHAEYNGKLQKERDSSYSELKKTKTKYDSVCQEVENRRKKADSAFDHGKSKAQNAYQQQMIEMNNAKNTYLININVTNKLKECYYHEYIPELLDSLQDLSETRVARTNALWTVAAQLEEATLSKGVTQMQHLKTEIPRNDPRLDSMMFLQHNISEWHEPGNMGFEPSPVWLDSDNMATDETSKVFLRNILAKSKAQAKQAKTNSDAKRREVENIKKVRQNIKEGKDKRDETEIVRALFAVSETLHAYERERLTAEVEVSTITAVVGDLSLGAKNHDFKSETFKIPTNCDLCGERIWGLSAKGFICRDCGFTCHSKCEMKVPAECPGEQTKDEKRKLKVERQAAATAPKEFDLPSPTNGSSSPPGLTRQNTMNSLSSGYAASAQRSLSGLSRPQEDIPEAAESAPAAAAVPAAPTPTPAVRRNRIVAPPPTAYISSPAGAASVGASNGTVERKGKMLYPYQANDQGEITVDEGREVTIVEPDGKLGSLPDRVEMLTG